MTGSRLCNKCGLQRKLQWKRRLGPRASNIKLPYVCKAQDRRMCILIMVATLAGPRQI